MAVSMSRIGDVAQGSVLLPEALQELPQVPTASAHRVSRQAPVSTHILGKLLDQIGIRARRDFRHLQTAEEAEPLFGVGNKAHPAVPAIGHVVSIRLATHPAHSSCADLLNIDVIARFQIQQVNKHQHVLSDEA
jgi:hypothetical protein